jgi:hypothetical protein
VPSDHSSDRFPQLGLEHHHGNAQASPTHGTTFALPVDRRLQVRVSDAYLDRRPTRH